MGREAHFGFPIACNCKKLALFCRYNVISMCTFVLIGPLIINIVEIIYILNRIKVCNKHLNEWLNCISEQLSGPQHNGTRQRSFRYLLPGPDNCSDMQFSHALMGTSHSTIHPIIHLLNHYAANNHTSNEHVMAIFCDLSKAFGTISFTILYTN